MSQRMRVFAAALLAAIVFPTSAADLKDAAKIKKCQDATGKWHYGDYAAVECAKSKVEVISDQGVKRREIAAPPTEAELTERERRKEEIEREKLGAEEQAKRDKNLLQTYAVEDDIILVRDRKLSQVEATIKASEETLKSLRNALTRMETQKQSEQEKDDKKALAQTEKGIAQTKTQIARHEAVVTQERQKQENLRKQYAEELKRYRELKLQQQSRSPTKKSATP